jgi:transcriptional regulator with XRE-family HTH domain
MTSSIDLPKRASMRCCAAVRMIVGAFMPLMWQICYIVSTVLLARRPAAFGAGYSRVAGTRVMGTVPAPTLRTVLGDLERKQRLAFAIQMAMARRGLTPPKLARILDKHADTVRRWRDGETAPSVLEVFPLAEALGVDPSYLINPPAVPEYPLDDYLVEPVERPTVEDADRALDDELAGPAASTLQQPTRDRRATGGGSGTGRPARGA